MKTPAAIRNAVGVENSEVNASQQKLRHLRSMGAACPW